MEKLDKSQQFLHSEYQSHIASATGALGSLKADYNSANSDFSSATSVSLSVVGNPFDPNGSVVASQAVNSMNDDRQHMAHDSAVAPNFQGQYQQWSMKDNDLMNQASGNAGQLGAELAGSNSETLDDLKNEAKSGTGNDVHFE